MSPEEIASPESVSAASDLYSVGAVAYFLLTGEPVFAGDNVIQRLSQCADAGAWREAHARAWWRSREGARAPELPSAAPGATRTLRIDLEGRAEARP